MPKTQLLALDPSVRSPGIAIFKDGTLVIADRVKIPKYDVEKFSDGARWDFVARRILASVRPCLSDVTEGATDLVFELPQIYTWGKSKGDPNDLVGLAGVAGALVGHLVQSFPLLGVYSPTPAEWIGQLPKSTKGSAKESPRAQRILSRLSAEELARVPDQHDALDAVGLGLWRLGRLEPRRVFSNGR